MGYRRAFIPYKTLLNLEIDLSEVGWRELFVVPESAAVYVYHDPRRPGNCVVLKHVDFPAGSMEDATEEYWGDEPC